MGVEDGDEMTTMAAMDGLLVAAAVLSCIHIQTNAPAPTVLSASFLDMPSAAMPRLRPLAPEAGAGAAGTKAEAASGRRRSAAAWTFISAVFLPCIELKRR